MGNKGKYIGKKEKEEQRNKTGKKKYANTSIEVKI